MQSDQRVSILHVQCENHGLWKYEDFQIVHTAAQADLSICDMLIVQCPFYIQHQCVFVGAGNGKEE